MNTPDTAKVKQKRLFRDFLIPRRGNRVALLRLEYPLTETDINHIRTWLDILSQSLIETEEEGGERER